MKGKAKRLLRWLLLTLAVMLFACAAVVGCAPGTENPEGGGGGNQQGEGGNQQGGGGNQQGGGDPEAQTQNYVINVRSLGGVIIPGCGVSVQKDGKKLHSGTTTAYGKFEFTEERGEFEIRLENLPEGYSLQEGQTLKVSADKPDLTIYVTSSVIQKEIPADKVYHIGDVMYDFTIEDENGRQYTLSETLKTKKMVLLNFWNTNCGPCMSEMPELELAYRGYQNDAEVYALNVPLLGQNNNADLRTVRNATYTDADGNPYSITFPMAIDKNSMPAHFAMNAIPVTVVVDRYGVISFRKNGSMDRSTFETVFAKFCAEDYEQSAPPSGGDENPEGPDDPAIPQREKPDVSAPDSKEIEAAISADSDSFSYYPERESADAEYSWPWLVGEENGETFIYPANHGKNYSFATIYSEFTIEESQIGTENGKCVLAFDLKISSEDRCDYFYVILDNSIIYEYSGTEHWSEWEPCYPLVAKEAGTHRLALMYMKDQERSVGADTVRIKNMRLISTKDISVPSLDMPRGAAEHWSEEKFSFGDYVNAVKGADGFYRAGTETGPYLLANLMAATNFNYRLQTNWSLSEFAVNLEFDYNTVEEDDPSYQQEKNKTAAITKWLQAANNSELPGLTVVNDELKNLLEEFARHKIGKDYTDATWLEFCIYFEHYGTDETDTGINAFGRNPVRGLLPETAFPMVEPHEGAFTNLDDIAEKYRNKVVQDRVIVPRGLKYAIKPAESGVYRFRSQSKQNSDTMAWLRLFDPDTGEEKLLVETDEQREDPDKPYNFVLTYYLEAGKTYILSVCHADVGGTGEFTFTSEYLGKEAYVFEYISRNYLTFTDETSGALMNYENVKTVEKDGVWYAAKKDAEGNYVMEGGEYVADENDPILVDFLGSARFFDNGGSLKRSLEIGRTETVLKTLKESVFAQVWKNFDADSVSEETPLQSVKGGALTAADRNELIAKLAAVYGDVTVEGSVRTEFDAIETVGELIGFMQKYFIGFFNFTNVRFPDDPDLDPLWYADFTSVMEACLKEAEAFEGTEKYGYSDKGCVKLTETLKIALTMFSKRFAFQELDTDWMRFCAHIAHFGGAAQDGQ